MSQPLTMLKAENIGLDLPLIGERKAVQVDAAVAQVGGRLLRLIGADAKVRALDEISFELRHGDRVGIVGRNGAGKSTLLRLLAGIYQPSAGSLTVQGHISTLFTNRLGLNDRATGRENIRLAGHLLGLTGEQIDALVPEIVDFSELGEFIDLPLRTYSSGMSVRLSFAVATALDPEILLIDEVFGAGDRDFQNKAQARVTQLIENSGLLVLASHSAALLGRFCTKILWLEKGRLVALGETKEILAAYEESVTRKTPA